MYLNKGKKYRTAKQMFNMVSPKRKPSVQDAMHFLEDNGQQRAVQASQQSSGKADFGYSGNRPLSQDNK